MTWGPAAHSNSLPTSDGWRETKIGNMLYFALAFKVFFDYKILKTS
jgi:hypothetical protein